MSKVIRRSPSKADGLWEGPSHEENGIPAVNVATGQHIEFEGGEVVITAPAVADDKKREFEGELLTNKQILSRINESGGGVCFAEEGMEVPTKLTTKGTMFNYGGETLRDYEIVNRIFAEYGAPVPKTKIGHSDASEVTLLKITDKDSLSTQLKRLTGDSYSAIDFESVDFPGLSSGHVFRHKRTGQKFVVSKGVTFLRMLDDGTEVYKDIQGREYILQNGILYTFTEQGEPLLPSGAIDREYLNTPNDLPMAKIPLSNNIIMATVPKYDFVPSGPISLNVADYKNPYEVNRAIERLLDSKEDDEAFNIPEKQFISYYSGYGGLEKFGATGKGILYEYFTPDEVVEKMWALAYRYGFGDRPEPSVFEPSVGTGNFLKYAPDHALVAGNEINPHSTRICRILYPLAEIYMQSFEQNFISRNLSIKGKTESLRKYDLVIGNPPYGAAQSKFMGMGEADYTHSGSFTEYFIARGLDLLKQGGLLIYVVGAEQYNGGSLFLDSGPSKVKADIFTKAQLMDAYRLPTKIFERTGVASEIIVLQKY